MIIRLNNRFFPDTHEKKDLLNQLATLPYSKEIKDKVLNPEEECLPLLALGPYSVLLGYVQSGEFKEWLEKRHVAAITADVLRPESAIVDLVLKCVNMYPKPDVLLRRLIKKLTQIEKSKIKK